MVRDGLTGYVVAPGAEESLAERLADVLHDPLSAREMGAAGRDHVVVHGSLEAMVEGYETLIATLHARKRGATGDKVEATTARLPR
jgi:glycosyltransferase involved in cell wall biosynthesis